MTERLQRPPAQRAPQTGETDRTRARAQVDFGTRWDWALSLEVAEHIPRELEANFVGNLDRHACRGLVLSWGNQAGEGHVNLRPLAEVEALFAARGFRSDAAAAAAMRQATCFSAGPTTRERRGRVARARGTRRAQCSQRALALNVRRGELVGIEPMDEFGVDLGLGATPHRSTVGAGNSWAASLGFYRADQFRRPPHLDRLRAP